ncbi:MAG: YHYH protein [Verrucomicrobia bacterium]|nr:YHYH protein [Verrucomicrobiota bacterium]
MSPWSGKNKKRPHPFRKTVVISFMRVFQFLAVICAAAFSPAWGHPGHEEGMETSSGAAVNLPPPQVSITTEGEYRVIRANGVPNHAIGQFPGPGCPNAASGQNYNFRMPLHPKTNASFTQLKQQAIGVAVNGVPFDPGTAEYWKNDRTSGWHIEALGGRKSLGLDQNNAHVQPNGAYHYHGIPTGLISTLGGGDGPKLIGYAADGFPIYGQSAQNRSSYRLKKGNRPGGTAGPGGVYDGTYEADYEFVPGSGDLDEANGRTGKTAEYPQGTYYYVATAEFPFYPRKLKGTPDSSFRRGPPGGGPGGGLNPGSQAGSQGKREGRGDPIQRYDKSGDGKISMEEAPPMMKANFSRHDANGDGFIDTEEAKSLPSRGSPTGNMGERPEASDKAPSDGGPMEKSAERKPWIENHLAELDTDGDGNVSLKEMTAEVAKVFQGYDGDRDGMIAQKEAEEGRVRSAMGGFLREHFSELDADHDGLISLEELRQAAVRMWEKYSQNKGGQTSPLPARP